jgi:hypothetical protein
MISVISYPELRLGEYGLEQAVNMCRLMVWKCEGPVFLPAGLREGEGVWSGA